MKNYCSKRNFEVSDNNLCDWFTKARRTLVKKHCRNCKYFKTVIQEINEKISKNKRPDSKAKNHTTKEIKKDKE